MTYHTHVIWMRNIASPGEVITPRVSLDSLLQLAKVDESCPLTDIGLEHLKRRYLGCALCQFVLLAEEILDGLLIRHMRGGLCPQEWHDCQVMANAYCKKMMLWSFEMQREKKWYAGLKGSKQWRQTSVNLLCRCRCYVNNCSGTPGVSIWTSNEFSKFQAELVPNLGRGKVKVNECEAPEGYLNSYSPFVSSRNP